MVTSRGVVSAVLLHRHHRRSVSRCRGELPGPSLSLKCTRMPCPPAHAYRSSWKVLSLDHLAGVGEFNGLSMVLRQWLYTLYNGSLTFNWSAFFSTTPLFYDPWCVVERSSRRVQWTYHSFTARSVCERGIHGGRERRGEG